VRGARARCGFSRLAASAKGSQIVVSERFEPGGETFTSLSSATAYARDTQSANGWGFWQLQTRRERRPLKELRDELICGER
jgi:hypothetical protein